ncbi:MAG: hypothetical protein ACOC6G_04315 [Thermoproteota archaeon]
MEAKKHLPVLPLMVLIVGSVSIIIVLLVSFSPALLQLESVENISEAKEVTEQYLARSYPGLEVREIMEFTENYYVVVAEPETGKGALELLVDRGAGRVVPEPGPNMMWNTKYGHHHFSNPTTVMPISLEQADNVAQEWLNRNIPGSTVKETKTFYGYYTMDLEENGEILGMMSVNGYDGDVWYHSWHGEFIRMKEYN